MLDNLVIVGETRTLPIGEAKYIKFDMYLDTEKDLKFLSHPFDAASYLVDYYFPITPKI